MATSQTAHKKAVFTETPASLGNQEVLFDPKQFNDFIYKHGYECTIERRLYCPCIDINTGQSLPDCLNCGGTGKFFINKQKSIIACQSMSNRNKYESWSITNMGTVSITAMPKDKMGFEDRVTLTELEMWFSEVLTLKKSLDNTKVFALTKYFPLVVFYVYQFNGVGNPLILIDPSKYTFIDNQITFDLTTFGSLVPLNASVVYTTNPQYYVIDINRDLVKTLPGKMCDTVQDTSRQNLPLNYVGRLVHILPDAPVLGGTSLYDNTNYSTTPNPNFDI
jgi:hypothetical protein